MENALKEVPTCELVEELKAREEVDNVRRLDCVSRQEKKVVLINVIVDCMRAHQMTLKNLDEACAEVWELYRKNAML